MTKDTDYTGDAPSIYWSAGMDASRPSHLAGRELMEEIALANDNRKPRPVHGAAIYTLLLIVVVSVLVGLLWWALS